MGRQPAPALGGISIHAPREGGDLALHGMTSLLLNFNPRPPRGGRPPSWEAETATWEFQSTPPARGATAKMHSFTCGSLTNK